MAYEKTFDEILDAMLQSYQTQLPTVDRSVGTLCYTKSAAISAELWGVYKFQEYIKRMIFPDTADTATLEKHAAARGLDRLTDETDAQLLDRLLLNLRQPPAGGNMYDWQRWAKEVTYTHASYTENVVGSWAYENPRGIGTTNLVILTDRPDAGYEGTATSEILSAVESYVDGLRPVGSQDFLVKAVYHDEVNVAMAVTGVSAAVKTEIENDITAYIKSLDPGETVFRAKIMSIAVDNGAQTVSLSTPSSDVTILEGPDTYNRAWPGGISVS